MLTKKEIEQTGLTGLEFEEANSRNYPLGDFAVILLDMLKVWKNGVKVLLEKWD